jgi:uncharacterized protein YraI
MKLRNFLAAAALLVLPAISAEAATGITTASIYMHSGPARGYPVLAHLNPGEALTVHGCTAGFVWCDVSSGISRGWVAGRFIDTVFDTRHVAFVEYAPRMDVPVVVFEQKPYWETNYRRYPFFVERQWWTAVPDELPEQVRIYTYNE